MGHPSMSSERFNDAKTAARELASTKGHRLGRWRRKASAPNTAATAVCQSCAALAVVNTERGTASIGLAVTARCQRGRA